MVNAGPDNRAVTEVDRPGETAAERIGRDHAELFTQHINVFGPNVGDEIVTMNQQERLRIICAGMKTAGAGTGNVDKLDLHRS